METDTMKIEHSKITTAEEWEFVTQDVQPDDHVNSYKLQLQYSNLHQNELSSDTGFLMINDNGKVCANGNKDDIRTCLEVVHDFETDRYWIICRGGKYTGNIIYMKGYELKTRKMGRMDDKDHSTYFRFLSRGSRCNPPYKISSVSGVPLQFNNKGTYIADPPGTDVTDYDDPYYFYPYKVICMKCTTV